MPLLTAKNNAETKRQSKLERMMDGPAKIPLAADEQWPPDGHQPEMSFVLCLLGVSFLPQCLRISISLIVLE